MSFIFFVRTMVPPLFGVICAMAFIPIGFPYVMFAVLFSSLDPGADVNVLFSEREVSTIESATTDF